MQIDIKTWDSNIEFEDPLRIDQLVELLETNKDDLSKLGAAWIHSQNLRNQGESAIKSLTEDIFKTNAMVVQVCKVNPYTYGQFTKFDEHKYIDRLRTTLLSALEQNTT